MILLETVKDVRCQKSMADWPFFAVVVVAAACGGAGVSEGRQALRLGRGVVARAQPLRHAHRRVRSAAEPGRLQQPAGHFLPAASRLPATVLGLPTAPGPGLVEVSAALPRGNVQGGNVLRLVDPGFGDLAPSEALSLVDSNAVYYE